METIKDQAAIISGGASGMGAETARALAAAGAKVTLLDTNIDAARILAKEIHGYALPCDVSDATSAEQAFMEAKEVHGPLRLCINCAGVAPAKRILGREGVMPLEDFSRVIQINLIGTFNLIRLASAQMATLDPLNEDGERGVIVNTASIAAYEGQIGQAAYSASKGGVVGMTLACARDLAKFGIRVMTIAPGIIKTPMIAAMPDEVQESLAAQMPFPRRLGHPQEFAKLVLTIIENSYLNGEVIRLDAAIRMQPK